MQIKPDGVQRALVGDIISRFERKGFTLKGLRMFVPSKDLAEEHYKDLSSKPFFPDLVSYITSGPVVAMVSACPSKTSIWNSCSLPSWLQRPKSVIIDFPPLDLWKINPVPDGLHVGFSISASSLQLRLKLELRPCVPVCITQLIAEQRADAEAHVD